MNDVLDSFGNCKLGVTIESKPNEELDKYIDIKVIGKGSFGSCKLVKRKVDGMALVMKQINVLDMSPREREDAMNEVNVLAMLDHENIIAYYDSFIVNGTLHILMEYANAGDIHREIKERTIKKQHFTEAEILRFFSQLCLAVQFLHQKNILHRDLKTQNIFLSIVNGKSRVKLGDMGIAKILSADTQFARTVIGTPYYLSPEVCQDIGYDTKSDVWSLGCCLYELATLKHAFDAGSLPALVLKILKGNYPPIASFYSNDLRQLVSSMLQTDPRDRPSIDEIIELPFIQQYLNDYNHNTADMSNQTAQKSPISNNIPMSMMMSKSPPAMSSPISSSKTPVKTTTTSSSSSSGRTAMSAPTTPINKKTPSKVNPTTPTRSASSSSISSSTSSSSSSSSSSGFVRKPPVPKPSTPLAKPTRSAPLVKPTSSIANKNSRPLVKQSSSPSLKSSSVTSTQQQSTSTAASITTTPLYTPPARPAVNITSSSRSSSSRHSIGGTTKSSSTNMTTTTTTTTTIQSQPVKSIGQPSIGMPPPTNTISSSSSSNNLSSSQKSNQLPRRLSTSNIITPPPSPTTRPTTPSGNTRSVTPTPTCNNTNVVPRPPSSSSTARPSITSSSSSVVTKSTSTTSSSSSTNTLSHSSSLVMPNNSYSIPQSSVVINSKRPSIRASIETSKSTVTVNTKPTQPPSPTSTSSSSSVQQQPLSRESSQEFSKPLVTLEVGEESDSKSSRDKKLLSRTNALRHFCNSIFGEELFGNIYKLLKTINGTSLDEDDENVQQQLETILGDKIYYLKYLQQLMYCESQLVSILPQRQESV
ncbi:putative protein serine/threonine kinase [Cavenderia fasciculata]|uniref:non-specific serine/threonine protein kinase n=1 Tax=Cavenderia fasciculata TaxID=261658 RepID=F4PJU9_CACFS|nr:putative protein serine/threonine kinase [Cavenderia fasciculata]EGG23873.1 putative protein serine/threonine kinase [Cavenderia fasciculata]|eukprot:XP_004361724.1 putative protein serine/threonine kinase [Cavenderia fasciculata]